MFGKYIEDSILVLFFGQINYTPPMLKRIIVIRMDGWILFNSFGDIDVTLDIPMISSVNRLPWPIVLSLLPLVH